MKSLTGLTWIALSLSSVLALSRCGGGPQESTAPLAITTAALPNGTSLMQYDQTVQANGGVGPFSWSVSTGTLPHNLSLSASATNTVTISGAPDTAAEGLAFTLKVTDTAGHSATQTYTISILLEPDTLSPSAASLTFGPQLVGSASTAQTETLTNTGSSALVITGVTVTGSDAADFENTSTCGATLPAGASCAIVVTFAPNQLGPRTAAISITDNSAGSPHAFSLDGAGVTQGPNATVSAGSLGFGSQAVNTTNSPLSFTVSNYGTTTLNIANIVATTNFTETDDCIPSLASGASCTVNVTFTPNTTGNLSGTLSITDDASSSPQVVSLSGTGTAGKCVAAGGLCTSSSQCCSGLTCRLRGFQGVCR